MYSRLFLPASAVVFGISGFILRLRQWANTYDPIQERFNTHAYDYLALPVFLAAAVFLLLLAAVKAPKRKTFPVTCGDPIYMVLMASGGFLFFGAALLGLKEGMELMQMWRSGLVAVAASYPMSVLLCGGLCLAAGVGVLLTGKCAYRPAQGKSGSLWAVLPPFALLVWIFATHQSHATDPILMSYGVYLAAAILLTVAHYDAAGFYHGQRHQRRFLFCTLMGTVLAVTALADGLSLFQTAIAAACVITALGHAYAVLAPDRPAPPSEESVSPDEITDPEL